MGELLRPPDQDLDAADRALVAAANEHESFYTIAREEIRAAKAPRLTLGEQLQQFLRRRRR